MPIIPLLGVMFIGLKLAHVIAWSWLWVLSPFWMLPAIVLVLWMIGLTFGLSLVARKRTSLSRRVR